MIVVLIVFLLIGSLLFMVLGSVKEVGLVFICVLLVLVGGIFVLLVCGMLFLVFVVVGFIVVLGVVILNGLVFM